MQAADDRTESADADVQRERERETERESIRGIVASATTSALFLSPSCV